jgi:hypothetical protein
MYSTGELRVAIVAMECCCNSEPISCAGWGQKLAEG